MLAAEGRDLLVDLGHCTFVDSAIISLLLATQRTLKRADRRFELVIPRSRLRHPPLRDHGHRRALPRPPLAQSRLASMGSQLLGVRKAV